MNGSTERIAAAALKFPNGMVVKGAAHALALMQGVDSGMLQDQGITDLEDMEGHELGEFGITDGFVTTHGRFVNRQEAADIAAASSQMTRPLCRADKGLDSCDLAISPNDLRAAMAEDIVHEAIQRRRIVRSLAEFKFKDILRGGKADRMKKSDFNPKSLRKGAGVEREHIDDPAAAEEIAADHLAEFPKIKDKRGRFGGRGNYYDELDALEKKLKDS